MSRHDFRIRHHVKTEFYNDAGELKKFSRGAAEARRERLFHRAEGHKQILK